MTYMGKDIVQALVLVGGKASRLRRDGVAVESTKAFINLEGKPLLYWNLLLLHKAGIRKLVIAAHEAGLLHKTALVIRRASFKFSHIEYFQDQGLGVHGIPYELRYLLDDMFIFECGHSLNRPSHYKKLMAQRNQHSVVFTAYKPHPLNRRQPVSLAGDTARHTPHGTMAIAHPIAGSCDYAQQLASLDFNVDKIIRAFSENGLGYVSCNLPPEFDIKDEMDLALESYKRLAATLL